MTHALIFLTIVLCSLRKKVFTRFKRIWNWLGCVVNSCRGAFIAFYSTFPVVIFYDNFWSVVPLANNLKMKMLKIFLKSNSGAFVAIFAVLIPIVIAGAGLAVDIGFWYSSKRDLQNAADAGALAGGYEFIRTNSQGFATTEANSVAAKNVDGPSQVTTIFPAVNHIQVTVQATAGTFFFGSFISSPPVIRAVALAEFTEGETKPPACLNLLAPDGEGLKINGNGRVEMGEGCAVQVNSSDESAVKVNGEGARLISDDVCINGGFDVTTVNNISSVPKTGCPPITNPYEHLEQFLPSFGLNCPDGPVGEVGAITRVNFRGRTVETTTFNFGPGIGASKITVRNGVTVNLSGGNQGFPIPICFDLTVRAGGTLNLRGNLIFVNGARLIVQSQGNLNIFRPEFETDEFRGLSIISSESQSVTHDITGGGNIFIDSGRGISVPGSTIDINGNSGLVSNSVSISAKSLRVGGNTTVRLGQNPPTQSIQPRPGEVGGVRLID